jgi:hypothetical protein
MGILAGAKLFEYVYKLWLNIMYHCINILLNNY